MFTARVQYALILLNEIKTSKLKEAIKLKEVCTKYQLKMEFLVQTARKLRLAGYLTSIKGPGGGYLAAKDLGELSFLKLYKDMQPDTHNIKVVNCDERAKYLIIGEYEKFQETLLSYKV